MRDRVLERSQVVPVDVEEAFAFFADAWNLEAITPPWLRFRILEAPAMLGRGSLLAYRLRLFGLPIRWRTEIVEWRPPFGFTDVQVAGPYRRWVHTHRLRRVDGGTEIHDHLVYRLPYEPLAGLLAPVTVRPWLTEIFDYRARETAARLNGDHALTSRSPDMPRRFPFRFDPTYLRLAKVFGVTPDRAWVEVRGDELEARFGRWRVQTSVSNIARAEVTGPYAFLKTAGPARLAITDRGLTFASNGDRGLCLTFHSPVAGIDRSGRIRHRELTVTVLDVDGLAEALAPRDR
jgi:ligand-binding SRPBCC domain-containing protein